MPPRQLTARLLDKLLPGDDRDVVLLRVTVVGTKYGGRRRLEYELIDEGDAENGLSASMRCSGFTASVVVQELAAGRIARHGVVPPERCIDAADLVDKLCQRGLDIVLRQS